MNHLKRDLSLGAFLSIAILAITTQLSHADSNSNAVIKTECQKINSYANQGAKLYQQQQYGKALKAFKEQAAWTGFCSAHEEVTGKQISQAQLATAHNNVGLTYSKLGKPRWARAWYEISPESSKSQHNLKQLPAIQASKNKQGSYVNYAGQAAWNLVEIRDKKDHYQIDFSGLRMGLMAMLYGPNMGEFSINMPKTARTAEYRYEDCVIKIEFLPATAQGEYIKLSQNQVDSTCGFGSGVYADGTYIKVEDNP